MCAGHVAYMGEMRNVYMVLVCVGGGGELKAGDNLNDLGIDGRIIFNWKRKVWTVLIWLMMGKKR
jgi:hypothetical protein